MSESKELNRRRDDESLVGVPSHPVATGVGAVLGGAAAGAAAGSVGGPVGAVVGAAIGAVAGGLGADAVANSIDQVAEANYWRENFSNRPYVPADGRYDDYGPAYAFGAGAFERHLGRSFDEVEGELSRGWTSSRGQSRLELAACARCNA